MNYVDAEKMAINLMKQHSLDNWTFQFNRGKRLFGLCRHNKKTIYLSKYYVELNNEDLVKDTILHEIAHALVGVNHNHNNVWQSKALEIGARPVRCKNKDMGLVSIEGKYKYGCSNCDYSYTTHRIKTKTFACKDCCVKFNNGKFSLKYLIKEL